jgi:cysteine-rich repeat protein
MAAENCKLAPMQKSKERCLSTMRLLSSAFLPFFAMSFLESCASGDQQWMVDGSERESHGDDGGIPVEGAGADQDAAGPDGEGSTPDDAAAEDDPSICTDDDGCSDSNACNGAEACVDGACASGTPLPDGSACTTAEGVGGVCSGGLCRPAGCGNGTREGDEECDDGNAVPGDGCETDCLFTCLDSFDCEDADPCRDWSCIEGGTGRICRPGFTTAPCDDGDPCTTPDRCDGAGRCSGAPLPCTTPPADECSDAANLIVYSAAGTCDGSSGVAVCSYGTTLQPCEFGCQDGACLDSPLRRLNIDIYVDNFCNMNVVPPEVSVPPGGTAVLSYHNNSVDYAVDVWLSYGGGYLDLATGDTWNDPFEWCTGSSVYTAYADISTACSSHRLLIHCL